MIADPGSGRGDDAEQHRQSGDRPADRTHPDGRGRARIGSGSRGESRHHQPGEGERESGGRRGVRADHVERGRVHRDRWHAAEQHPPAAYRDLGGGEPGDPDRGDRDDHGVRRGLDRDHRGEQAWDAVSERVPGRLGGQPGRSGGQVQGERQIAAEQNGGDRRDRPRRQPPHRDPGADRPDRGPGRQPEHQIIGEDPPQHRSGQHQHADEGQRNDGPAHDSR
ncbi:hypothetical protein Q0Z83_066200 [Actinoplanes sichuanensis]|nr:hypothetical protein Q0Z83_066200 [Actinoplanes sichuanensis]